MVQNDEGTNRWKVNQPKLKEPLATTGGTLVFYSSLIENG